jgi:hypothetical protein
MMPFKIAGGDDPDPETCGCPEKYKKSIIRKV